MFKSIFEKTQEPITFFVDGSPVEANPGESVAAAMLAAGIGPFRTTRQSSAPRSPYCMMGVCFECLVEVDGSKRQQACMISVSEGLRVRRLKRSGDLAR